MREDIEAFRDINKRPNQRDWENTKCICGRESKYWCYSPVEKKGFWSCQKQNVVCQKRRLKEAVDEH